MADVFNKIVSHCAIVTGLSKIEMPAVAARLLVAMAENGDLEAGRVDAVAEAVLRREEVASTVLPDGAAFPHTRTDAVTQLRAAVGISAQGLELNAPDGGRTHIVVLVLSPASACNQHIQFMAGLSKKLLREGMIQNFVGTEDADSVRQLLLS